jgi:ABC-2 type transport system permease protein
MAVYKRTYKGYEGAFTPTWSRFSIVPRSSFARLFQSKFLVMYLVACGFYPLGCAVFIYLTHNLTFLQTFNIPIGQALSINARFFQFFCGFQGALAYLLTAFVGPGLVAPDLANNALPLYFCRPFTRAEYVLGKMSVLMILLSLITWIPGLLLFLIQSSLAGTEWMHSNTWIAGAIFVGLFLWDVVLSLIALALSAWVKWRIAAGALILGVYFAGAGFGAAINSIVRTKYGTLIDLAQVMGNVWAKMFRDDAVADLPVADSWIVLIVVCALCLWLLTRRVKAFEVVK